MNVVSVFLALRYLRSRKIVLLSVAAVGLSCALLITVAGLFTGFIDAFESGTARHMGDVILSAPSDLKIEDYDGLLAALRADRHVAAATPVLSSQGLLLLGVGKVRAVQVWGIELPGRSDVDPMKDMLLRQKDSSQPAGFGMDSIPAEEGGLIGIGIAAAPDDQTDEYDTAGILTETIGSPVVLTTGTVRKAESGHQDREEPGDPPKYLRKAIRFTVTDVVFTGMYELDQNFVYLPIKTLSTRLYPDAKPMADTIQIRLARHIDIERGLGAVKLVWNRWAAEKGLLWADYARIRSSRELQAQLIAEYHKQMRMLMGIFGLVSAGTILLIFCIFYLIVMTKQKDVAILKSCGLGSMSVGWLYVSFGLAIGMAGSGLGIVLG